MFRQAYPGGTCMTVRQTCARAERSMTVASFVSSRRRGPRRVARSSLGLDASRRDNKPEVREVNMRRDAKYAVACRDGSIAVSRDEAENLLERRGAAGRENPKYPRAAADQPRSGLRHGAATASRRVREMLSRAWQ